ncbi:MAG: hypothetical protein ABI670_16190 [Chloroflexota bacterium]
MNEDQTLSDLLSRSMRAAKTGLNRLSELELEDVVNRLKSGDQNQVKLIRILGYSGNATYREVLEPFLTSPNPTVVTSALWVLCEYWLLTPRYSDKIISIITGAYPDESGIARPFAMKIAANYLSDNECPKMLIAILEVYASPDTLADARVEAYHALEQIAQYPDLAGKELVTTLRQRFLDKT